MTTSRTEGLPATDPQLPSAAPADERTDPGGGRRRWISVALALLAVLPALLGLAGLLSERGEPYVPVADHALLGLSVDAVGQHEVLLGAYSRFGWYHPGPMASYLLAGPYALLDEAPQAMAAGALALAGLSSVVAVFVVRRRSGALPALWTLLVLVVSVHTLGDGFLRDSWNPHLPVLPLLAGALLCWTAVRGDAWALPLAVIPLSLAVQSHIGYLPPVGAIGAVLAAGLLVRAVRRLRSPAGVASSQASTRRPRRWLFAALAAAVLGLLLWLPPIVQQMSGTPGNLGLLVDYLRHGPSGPSPSIANALRAVADEFGRLPATAVGAGPSDARLLPQRWPPVAIAVGLALFLAAVATGVHRRRADVLWLGVLTVAVAAAGVAAVSRLEGLPWPYIARWTVVVGMLAWTTVGVSLLPEIVSGLRGAIGRSGTRRWSEALVGTPLTVLTTVAVLVAGIGTARAETPQTEVTGQLSRLAQAVVEDLDRSGLRTDPGHPVVRVDFAGSSNPMFLGGTLFPGMGLVLELARDDVDVQVSSEWRLEFGPRLTERASDAGYVVTLAYADGTSPPPEQWQRVLAVDSEFQVYGGAPPTG